jgi:hypothetical protein
MQNILLLTKLDAAKRQLETAIKLYFSEDDPVSIHTLSAAAYNILRDVGQNTGANPMMIKNMSLKYVIPGKEKLFLKRINEAENYFKHADKDHEATLKYDTSLAEFFIIDAINQYYQQTGEDTLWFKLFRGWFIALHTDLFNFPEHTAQQLQCVTPHALKLGKTEYMKKMLPELVKTI